MKLEEGKGVNKFDKVQQKLSSREEDAYGEWPMPSRGDCLMAAGDGERAGDVRSRTSL